MDVAQTVASSFVRPLCSAAVSPLVQPRMHHVPRRSAQPCYKVKLELTFYLFNHFCMCIIQSLALVRNEWTAALKRPVSPSRGTEKSPWKSESRAVSKASVGDSVCASFWVLLDCVGSP